MQFTTLTNPLDNFLQQPNIEASPAWEFIQGQAQQKPMPTLFHSRLQRNLVNAINSQTNAYEAIQELRCIVPPMSPVPYIAVVKSERLTDEDGPLQGSPDWLIEIRSPDQSTLDIQQKILHCLSNGTQLAWLIDIQRKQIWVWENKELPLVYANNDTLPSLGNISELTVATVMAMTQQR
ncbi:Uma2 family endonuclease [Trichormus sp. NMC-1]|uniref:Uma2 family endonuclease n=1 Tax=Trichormus sp. NMC-1 TaxID=1853259 RepID=UPI0008DBEC27|nr:Uma2 family endonuclease [Trichormus sp. NMC-1]